MSSTIKPIVQHVGQQHIIYDSSAAEPILPQWLDVEYWQEQARVDAVGLGRGMAWFITTSNAEYVLRHYRRGGMVAKISNDKYLWTGLEKTRAWCEWRLLAYLQQLQLPAPVPVAARVHQSGMFYSADLLTERLANTRSLSHVLQEQSLENSAWKQIGNTIQQFHQDQIYHADLNAHNILLGDAGQIYLIDFDRGRIKPGEQWKQENLNRLRRSLDKLTNQLPDFHFKAEDWQDLIRGYKG